MARITPDKFYHRLTSGPSILAAVVAILLVIGIVIGAYAGMTIFLGWIGFLLYRYFAPEAWPYIGLWSWVGIAFLVNVVIRPFRVQMKSD